MGAEDSCWCCDWARHFEIVKDVSDNGESEVWMLAGGKSEGIMVEIRTDEQILMDR